eukprot:151025_1
MGCVKSTDNNTEKENNELLKETHEWDVTQIGDAISVNENKVEIIGDGNWTIYTKNEAEIDKRTVFKIQITNMNDSDMIIGIVESDHATTSKGEPTGYGWGYGYISNGNKVHNSSSEKFGSSFQLNDIITIVVNLKEDTNALYFKKNQEDFTKAFDVKHSDYKLFVSAKQYAKFEFL